MSAVRLVFVAILVFYAAQALSLPETLGEPRDWSTYDHEHGQYSMAVLSAESSVLRYRVYVLTLEVSHTTKYIDKEIIALFTEAGTPQADIDKVDAEFTKRGNSIINNMELIMNYIVDLVNVAGVVNTDIASNATSKIATDRTLLKNQFNSFNTIYDLSMENSVLAATIAKNKIISTIGVQTGPQMDQILNYTQVGQDLLTEHMLRCNDTKLFVDQAYYLGDAALAQLVATAPVH